MASSRDTHRLSGSTKGASRGCVIASGPAFRGYSFTGRDVRVPALSPNDHRGAAALAARTTARRAYCTSSATELLVTERSA